MWKKIRFLIFKILVRVRPSWYINTWTSDDDPVYKYNKSLKPDTKSYYGDRF